MNCIPCLLLLFQQYLKVEIGEFQLLARRRTYAMHSKKVLGSRVCVAYWFDKQKTRIEESFQIYYFWHTSVILRRWRARTALGSVQNLLEVAKFHFTSQSGDRFDIIRLADFLDRTRNDQ